ncbi:hypothetical protein BU23DRAFT_234225 [Bimuria novae-zelandiae CBS 107.79]|uniref:Uncharacterized protein n=1 Tax=Bimuria novae-zelandiae CBS 107.79 TaxID=1447943 RepID=A0A6A5V0R2_9PLEO|nr:hypothetical protein BU23DRAFT_234225 [Bimuria novae-zelandiae CBS 107.79]
MPSTRHNFRLLSHPPPLSIASCRYQIASSNLLHGSVTSITSTNVTVYRLYLPETPWRSERRSAPRERLTTIIECHYTLPVSVEKEQRRLLRSWPQSFANRLGVVRGEALTCRVS